jgi:hypothetical protein
MEGGRGGGRERVERKRVEKEDRERVVQIDIQT